LSVCCLSLRVRMGTVMLYPGPRTTLTPDPYYTGRMASVRLDPEMEARLAQAAELRGESKSDFMRAAVGERIAATLGNSLADRLAHVIGQVDVGGGRAERAHHLAAARVAEAHRAQLELGPRRS
jgi:predicted DNA-binding protein